MEDFNAMGIQSINTLEDTMQRAALFRFIKRSRKLLSVKRNLFIQGNIFESKKIIIKFCNKLSMKVNLLVEFNREKHNLNYKSNIYKSKTDINFYKYLSKSIHKILNLKLVT